MIPFRVAELKRMINEIPASRDGELCAIYMPYFRRLFPIVAIDDLRTVRPDVLENQIVVITQDNPHEPARQ